jgi:para-nitrobenzyl esterase
MNRLASVLMLGLLAACQTAPIPDGPHEVKTTSGNLASETSAGISVFKGVPYAKPPVGDLRWAPPQSIKWDGIRSARSFGAPCLQPTNADGTTSNGGGVAGPTSEDCLYLNIWALANAKGAPVMLWLYGGGGTMGAGSVSTYDGAAFARDGVVLVTVNYRHGALAGFAHPAIATANGAPDANFHLLDSIAAIEWVKANASAFGGDAGNITVFGESAGATIVANLVTSPMTKGLFHKAIIESTGSLPTPGATLRPSRPRMACRARTPRSNSSARSHPKPSWRTPRRAAASAPSSMVAQRRSRSWTASSREARWTSP